MVHSTLTVSGTDSGHLPHSFLTPFVTSSRAQTTAHSGCRTDGFNSCSSFGDSMASPLIFKLCNVKAATISTPRISESSNETCYPQNFDLDFRRASWGWFCALDDGNSDNYPIAAPRSCSFALPRT